MWSQETLNEIYPEPDGYCIIHHRAAGSSTCTFGPFKTVEAAEEWLTEHPDVSAYLTPLYLTVDWRR
jgi:hypothetical protein